MRYTCEQTAQLPFDKPEGACAVHWAEEVVRLACERSCGQDVMCRDGVYQLYLIIHDIAQGKGRARDLELLPELCSVIAQGASCALAAGAAERVARSLSSDLGEWSAHTLRRLCRAGVCPIAASAQPEKPLMRRRRRCGGD